MGQVIPVVIAVIVGLAFPIAFIRTRFPRQPKRRGPHEIQHAIDRWDEAQKDPRRFW